MGYKFYSEFHHQLFQAGFHHGKEFPSGAWYWTDGTVKVYDTEPGQHVLAFWLATKGEKK